MLKTILEKLGIIPDKEEKKLLMLIKRKQMHMSKYGGKIVAGKNSLTDVFETKQGRIDYENSCRRFFFNENKNK